VGRMLKEKPQPAPRPVAQQEASERVVTSKYPNHLWLVDLTTVSTGLGFWCSWLPFALPQRWPFCWWLALAIDHFSRKTMGFAVFESQPSSRQVRAFLGRTIAKAGRAPRHLVCDKGGQFWCPEFKAWCKRKGIKPRFGAVHKYGSIAIIERLISTTKRLLRLLPQTPLRRDAFRREIGCLSAWYNEDRPHASLRGCTPNERYFGRFPANRRPRFEPRDRWPRGSPCARPWALVRGKPGARLELDVGFHAGRRHLPIVRIRRAA
jgi:transposase InsO family protein